MNVYRDKPPTDLDLRILSTINANPNVCTVPDKVNINENSPSLKTKYNVNIIPANITQYAASYFLKMPIPENFRVTILKFFFIIKLFYVII